MYVLSPYNGSFGGTPNTRVEPLWTDNTTNTMQINCAHAN